MKTVKLLFILLVLSGIYIGCTKDDGGSDSGIFIPDYSNQWINADSSQNKFFFLPAVDTPTNHSDLTGNETSNDIITNTFSGSFTNHDITFKYVTGPKTGQTYSGKINDASTQIKFTNGITLNKQQ